MSKNIEQCLCPHCKEEVKAEAVKCKHCHSTIIRREPVHEGTCPFCKEEIKLEATLCRHCKSSLVADDGTFGSISGCGCNEPYPHDLKTSAILSLIGKYQHTGPGPNFEKLKDNNTTSGTKTICFPCIPDNWIDGLLGTGKRWCFDRTFDASGGYSDGPMYQLGCTQNPSLGQILADPTYPYPGPGK